MHSPACSRQKNATFYLIFSEPGVCGFADPCTYVTRPAGCAQREGSGHPPPSRCVFPRAAAPLPSPPVESVTRRRCTRIFCNPDRRRGAVPFPRRSSSVRRPSSSVTGRSRFRVNLNGEKALEKLGTRKMAKGRGGHCRSREAGTTRPSLRPRNSAGTGYSRAACGGHTGCGRSPARRASTARGGRRGRAGRELATLATG